MHLLLHFIAYTIRKLTGRNTFGALSFLILISPTPFTIFSLHSNWFPRCSNEVSIHSISSSSNWIGRWLSCDISCDVNRALIFYLNALHGKNIQDVHWFILSFGRVIRYLSLLMISIEVSYTVDIYSCLLETSSLHRDMLSI